jgi:hypothetical protein
MQDFLRAHTWPISKRGEFEFDVRDVEVLQEGQDLELWVTAFQPGCG